MTEQSNDRLLRFSELRELVGLSRTTVWELEQQNKFPRRVQLSPRRVAWKLSEIEAWMANRPAA